ncbi:hypothetical protein, partial [Haemophilus influenzae]|uniref:hypothetical protein n=1 Tax=Haemophilus influenzae TaxID=727 RepID=UPI001E33A635
LAMEVLENIKLSKSFLVKFVFTPDECNIVRNSLQKDGVEKKIRENIISCLSSISGIGNLYYACSGHGGVRKYKAFEKLFSEICIYAR